MYLHQKTNLIKFLQKKLTKAKIKKIYVRSVDFVKSKLK